LTAGADLHSDLLLDVLLRRIAGERDVVAARHLEPLRQAGVRVQVLAAWTDPALPQEAALPVALRTLEAAHREAEASDGAFRVATTAAELDAGLEAGALVGVLALEGAEPLGADPELLPTFHRLGVRMVGPTWNRANAFADGAAEPRAAGLTAAGRGLVQLLGELGMALDLAHLSRRACSEALELATGPVLASHANADAVYASARNLPDDVLAEVGRRDGVVGLNFVPVFVGDGPSAERLADHHAHLARVAGPHAPACGADFIGFLPPAPQPPESRLPPGVDPALARRPEPPRETAYADLAAELRRRGVEEPAVDAVLGGNALRFLRRLLG
jgi:membrane dipeptidase